MKIVESLNKTLTLGETTYNYYYRLIRSDAVIRNGKKLNLQTYGIEVERQDYSDNNIINIERDNILFISPQRHKVHNLLKLAYENEVSPLHLVEVLGEYVDEYIVDFDDAALDKVQYN
ncbi:hypothetical protein IAI10_05550 [Clostridium sp. 19966]|uniref:DUF6514 family protein n=1 Tax=Clostridium sp. 19966 TaxID=2768166 RepID=UPI0028E05565|nr:DUF6514 family protein [Clostridium sp. 19966]MDT8716112.1 hypothetical protein [Clostridium sp. 19966]